MLNACYQSFSKEFFANGINNLQIGSVEEL